MNLLLRSVAGFAMILGVVIFALSLGNVVKSLGSHGIVSVLGSPWMMLGFFGSGVVATLGGVLWSLSLLAYRPAAGTTPVSSPAAPTSVHQRRCDVGSVLRVLALVQIGVGVIAFAAGCYLMWPSVTKVPRADIILVWDMTFRSWGFACLGGIMWALTRMAYPPQRA